MRSEATGSGTVEPATAREPKGKSISWRLLQIAALATLLLAGMYEVDLDAKALAAALALLAMATGDFSLTNPSPGEVRRGPQAASLTVSQSAKAEVVLRVVLRNVSDQRQSFFLERPGAEFFVKDGRGAVVHASVPCLQTGPCDAGLPEPATLEPGAQMEFVERWRPRGRCLPPGPYTVKAKLRAYQGPRPEGVGDGGTFVPFTPLTGILVRRDGET